MLPNETRIFECQHNEYELSTDRSRLDIDYILRFLNEKSWWAKDRTKDEVVRSIAGSISFGIYSQGKQVGFARIVTDCSVLAYLMDVFIDPDHRGKGLGTWLSGIVLQHPDLGKVPYWRLATIDTHEVYKRAGWEMFKHPEWIMEYQSRGDTLAPLNFDNQERT